MKTIKISEGLHRLLKVRAAETGEGLQDYVEVALKVSLGFSAEAVLPEPKRRTKKQQKNGKKDHGEGT